MTDEDLEVPLPSLDGDDELLYNIVTNEETIYINTDESRLDEIMLIVEYYQLNNVILNLKLNSLNDYDLRYNNILKDITIDHYYFGVADPSNTNSINCTLKISSELDEFTKYSLTTPEDEQRYNPYIPKIGRNHDEHKRLPQIFSLETNELKIVDGCEMLPFGYPNPEVHWFVNFYSNTIDFKVSYSTTIMKFQVDCGTLNMFPNRSFITDKDIELSQPKNQTSNVEED